MKTLGVIAGNGDFPLLVVNEARQQGVGKVVVVALVGETKEEIESLADVIVWVEIGQLEKVIHAFKTNGCSQVIMAGQVTPVKLYTHLKLDLRMAEVLKRTPLLGAEPIFSGIAEEMEKDGLSLLDSSVFIQNHLATEGLMTQRAPSPAEERDIILGRKLARSLADLDIGQTIVLKMGTIVAVEAIEGTNHTIRRAGQLAGPGTVIVKVTKSKQDRRFDLPVIGEETLKTMKESGATVLALDAKGAIMVDKARVIELADSLGITIKGYA